MDFLVAKDDLQRCRFAETAPPELEPGQALLTVDVFGLTSNNITYAVFGQSMSYWDFFPAEEGWGRVPVWGFAEVAASRNEALEVGTRVFGYLPCATELVVEPARIDARGFRDGSPHRAALPAAYNDYLQVKADPVYDAGHEDQQMLLRPLFFTSYLLADFLAENGLFHTNTAVISSASSRTASALAFLLGRRGGIEVVGLTSAGNAEFVRRLGVYDQVAAYEDLSSLPAQPAVYVDFAGDAELRLQIHRHFGEQLAHSAVVGASHHERLAAGGDPPPGPRPRFFFAPDQAAKRSRAWGREGLESRLAEAWRPYLEWVDGWLEALHARGPQAVERTYLELLDGKIDPSQGHVLSLSA